MKRFIFIILPVFILFTCSFNFISCTSHKGSLVTSNINVEDIPKSNPAYAYYKAFLDIYDKEIHDNKKYKYLAVDLSYAVHDDASNLTALFLDYCDTKDYTLLLGTMSELEEKGYKASSYFDNGFKVDFMDREIDDERKLVFSSIMWIAENGARIIEYTAELIDGEWEITKSEGKGMS